MSSWHIFLHPPTLAHYSTFLSHLNFSHFIANKIHTIKLCQTSYYIFLSIQYLIPKKLFPVWYLKPMCESLPNNLKRPPEKQVLLKAVQLYHLSTGKTWLNVNNILKHIMHAFVTCPPCTWKIGSPKYTHITHHEPTLLPYFQFVGTMQKNVLTRHFPTSMFVQVIL